MSKLNYRVVSRRATLGPNKGKEVYGAQPVLTGKISFDNLCRQLADGSTVDAADVKAVLSRMATVISRNLEMGMSVDCGELGLFRPSFGSKSVEREDDFTTQLISRPKVVFTPRAAFKNSLQGVGFERVYRGEEEALRAAKRKKDTSGGGSKPSGGTPSGGADHAGV